MRPPPTTISVSGKKVPYPQPSTPPVSAVMRSNKKTGTRPEVRVRSLLHRRGYRFRMNLLIKVAGCSVRPDLVFTRQRVAVFVDGCFWHCCPVHGNQPKVNTSYWGSKLARNVERDRTVTSALRADGWTVVRVWEHVPVEEAVEVVVAALNDGTTPESA
jgi:DNA mismatch endonuclease, patch repair protein